MSSSDSSEDEDLSRFKDVVDTSFLTSINKITDKLPQEQKPHSNRYLDVSSHYNDVKVPHKLQNQIGTKISAILNKSIEYVDVHDKNPKEYKIEAGIKLFTDSEGLLSCDDAYDNFTEKHNNESKKLKQKIKRKRRLDSEVEILTEMEKLRSVAVNAQHILSKKEIKYWQSRRKIKLYKYKAMGKNKVLMAVD